MKGTLLAFDFGTRRIGVAVGDRETRLAHPLATIAEEANAPRFARIGALISEWCPAALVVGLPLSPDGAEHDMTQRCRRFANQLHGRFGLPVALVDERYSSVAAEARLGEAGVYGRARKAALDSVAAQEILQDYLDHHASTPSQ